MSGAPLGYFVMPSGISNQKLALLGLVLRALREGPRRIVVPTLCNYAIGRDNHTPVPFGDIFNAQKFAAFAARQGITIDWARSLPGAGDACFDATGPFLDADLTAGLFGPDHIVCEFLRALVPHLRASFTFRRLARQVFEERGVRIAAQLRIENDWAEFSGTVLQNTTGAAEDNLPGFRAIIDKIRNSLQGWRHGIYVTCDETALPLPKEEIRAAVRDECGVELLWKSDLLAADEFADMRAIHASLLDFEMAMAAPVFVGLSRSTFSNLACMEKFANRRHHIRNHHIYNLPGPRLGRRRDNGTQCVARLAIEPVTCVGIGPAP